MYRDAVHIAVGHLHLAGVQSRADGEAEVFYRVANRARTVDRSRRTVERCEGVVAGELDDRAARAGHVPLDEAVVGGSRMV